MATPNINAEKIMGSLTGVTIMSATTLSASTLNLISNVTTGVTVYTTTGSTPVFLIDTKNFRLGVNTLTPSYSVDVTGDVNLTGSLRVSSAAALDLSGSNLRHGLASGIISQTFYSLGNIRMTLDGFGNIGLGTTTPGAKLSIVGTGATNATTAMTISNSSGLVSFTALDNGSIIAPSIFTTTLSASSIISASTFSLQSNNSPILAKDSTGAFRTLINFTAGDNITIAGRLGTTDIILNPTVAGSGLYVKGVNGSIGLGVASPSAKVHLQAGTSAASGGALKFTSGQTQTTPESGATEYNGTQLFFTPSGTTRTTFILNNYGGYSAETNVTLNSIGSKLIIASGTNASIGTVVFTAGTATVLNTLVTASSLIIPSIQAVGVLANLGQPYISARVPGVSFTISSTNILDTDTIGWQIIEPK